MALRLLNDLCSFWLFSFCFKTAHRIQFEHTGHGYMPAIKGLNPSVSVHRYVARVAHRLQWITREMDAMGDALNYAGDHRIEVSGWDVEGSFFVEKTDLLRSQSGQQVRLRRFLPAGTIIFVRLLAPQSLNRPLPIAYQIQDIRPFDSNGLCEMRLLQMCPRIKAPIDRGTASDVVEDSPRTCAPRENSIGTKPEEILQ